MSRVDKRFVISSLVAIGVCGCAVGGGTSTVGIWRPKRVVDTDVCIEEEPGRCTQTVQVARDSPARTFGGGVLSWFNPGYMHLSGVANGTERFVLDSHYEYLRGRGGYALGVRVGANLAFDLHDFLFAVPLTLVGHWGYPQFSVYGGVGYTPYARDRVTMSDNTSSSTELHGPNVLVGGRVRLREGVGYQVTTNVEAFQQYFDGAVATSISWGIGLHF